MVMIIQTMLIKEKTLLIFLLLRRADPKACDVGADRIIRTRKQFNRRKRRRRRTITKRKL